MVKSTSKAVNAAQRRSKAECLTVAEVSKLFRLNEKTTRMVIKRHDIPHFVLARRLLVPRIEAEKFVARMVQARMQNG